MKDYREHIGKRVSILTDSGSFQGKLSKVGSETLTIEPTAYFEETGEPGKVPTGLVMLDRLVIKFVQVVE